jgi:dephospho-CoA kinase
VGLRVGLTGGLASGKTFVSEELERLGCFVVHADALGHAVLMPGGEAYEATVGEFGAGILNPDGTINRRLLAAAVFESPERLERLNSFVHPPVRARGERAMAEFFERQPDGIAVVEAAILVETGSWRNYDKLIVVVCTPEQQIERAMKRDGLSREEAMARLARQMPLAEKVRYADYVIDTSAEKEHAIEQTRRVYGELRSLVR